ncbi:FRG domain-containing protein [Pisciglobus halotolerans]|uniref:FRG domain-containing protein n=1 Tax=Pisciglobus halotolerans TaxID=745365 RepID=A0A1I3DLS6_9LACT|nr:FRG domain-containing protein [Pisciglobus halotolerans]SFH87656.1 FRG domain-containing protein [Pisciglobus halotolerans]
MKVEEAIRKIESEISYNGIVCIDDFIIQHEVEDTVTSNHDESTKELIKTKDFIDNYLRNNEQLNENKFEIKSYEKIVENSSPVAKSGRKKSQIEVLSNIPQKYYLIRKNIEIRIINDIFFLLENFHTKNKNEALSKVAHYKSEIQTDKQRISRMHKIEEIEIETEEVFAEFKNNMKEFYYRGHDSVNYTLLPSICRNNWGIHESEIYYEILSTSPQDFSSISRHIDILRKMQHYGTPTRLLDITSNPLVGLYFAVSQNDKYDGEFIIFNENHKDIKTNFSDTIEILCSLSTQSKDQKNELYKDVIDYKEKMNSSNKKEKIIEDFNKKNAVKLLLHEIRQTVGDFEPIINPQDLTKSFFIRPFLDNERIVRQSGAFIVTSLDSSESKQDDLRYKSVKDSIEKFRYKEKYSENEKESKEENHYIRYIIPSVYKEQIRADLSVLGINEQYLFPDLQTISNYIKKQYFK